MLSPFAEATVGGVGGGDNPEVGYTTPRKDDIKDSNDDDLKGLGFGLFVVGKDGKRKEIKLGVEIDAETATEDDIKSTVITVEPNLTAGSEPPETPTSYIYLVEGNGVTIDQTGRSAKFSVDTVDLKVKDGKVIVPDDPKKTDDTENPDAPKDPKEKNNKKLVNAGNLSTTLNNLGWKLSANGDTASTAPSTDPSIVNSGEEVEFKGDGVTVTTTTETNGKHVVTIKAEKTQGGADGKSAYDIWKAISGNEGKSETDFAKAIKGADGKSAYDLWKAKDGNADKSEADFLASLKGDKGENGTKIAAGNGIKVTSSGNEYTVSADLPFTKNNDNKSIRLNEEGVIRNVANGRVAKDSKDAVNGGQLHAVESRLSGNMDKLNHRIDKMGKRADAGTASAIATANLLQSYRPGLSAATAAVGQYRGQSAVAVGYSRLSDNGKYGVKFSLGANTQGNVGAGAGVAYFW